MSRHSQSYRNTLHLWKSMLFGCAARKSMSWCERACAHHSYHRNKRKIHEIRHLKAKILTSMCSFSVQGKHLRNPTTASSLGPMEFSAKTFTVLRDDVKSMGIIFWRTSEHTSRIIAKCEYSYQDEDWCTVMVMPPILRKELPVVA